jgi:hypothetical protein
MVGGPAHQRRTGDSFALVPVHPKLNVVWVAESKYEPVRPDIDRLRVFNPQGFEMSNPIIDVATPGHLKRKVIEACPQLVEAVQRRFLCVLLEPKDDAGLMLEHDHTHTSGAVVSSKRETEDLLVPH